MKYKISKSFGEIKNKIQEGQNLRAMNRYPLVRAMRKQPPIPRMRQSGSQEPDPADRAQRYLHQYRRRQRTTRVDNRISGTIAAVSRLCWALPPELCSARIYRVRVGP